MWSAVCSQVCIRVQIPDFLVFPDRRMSGEGINFLNSGREILVSVWGIYRMNMLVEFSKGKHLI